MSDHRAPPVVDCSRAVRRSNGSNCRSPRPDGGGGYLRLAATVVASPVGASPSKYEDQRPADASNSGQVGGRSGLRVDQEGYTPTRARPLCRMKGGRSTASPTCHPSTRADLAAASDWVSRLAPSALPSDLR